MRSNPQQKKSASATVRQMPFFLDTIGDTLYSLGFSAEIALVKMARLLRNGSVFFAGLLALLFRGIAKKLAQFIKAVGADIAEPLRHVTSGIRNLRNMAAGRRTDGETAKAADGTIGGYLVVGIKKHGHLLGNFTRLLLPLLALAIFGFTFYSTLSMQYALAVTVEDVSIGYVENETVLEDALGLLRMRISLAEGQDMEQWQVLPQLSVGATTATMNKTQVADKILESSPEKLLTGYGVYVDGRLVGATQDGEQLRAFLEKQKEPYYTSEFPDAEVSFVRQVDVPEQQEVFLADSVEQAEVLEKVLRQNISEEESHTVLAGESLKSIAYEEKIMLDELIARNPEIEGRKEDYQPPEGSVLLVRHAQPYLQVKTVYQYSAEEPVAYETVERESDKRPKGQRTRVQRGKNGKALVFYEVTIIDGEEVSTARLEELTQHLHEPQEEVFEVGIKEGGGFYTGDLLGNIGGGAGGYIWPVPGASGSSRGFIASHGGVDINAPSGTPIYASNGGVVTFAGTGSGSYWSYGNFVEIAHGDGMVTRYAHCSEVLVAPGQEVAQGQLIALVGNTGLSTGPHCHFETVVGGVRVNPYNYVASPF